MLSLSLSVSFKRVIFREFFLTTLQKATSGQFADPFLYLYLAESQIDERCGDLAKL